MIGETRVLANSGYGTPICQTLNRADKANRNRSYLRKTIVRLETIGKVRQNLRLASWSQQLLERIESNA
jgi:hypothetical protein